MVQGMGLAADKKMDASMDDATDTLLGFTIVCLVSAVFSLIASILFSMWCCCGSADLAKSSKHAFHGAICQTVSFVVFTISWFLMGAIIPWTNVIGCIIDTLFYVYIVMVAKRYHAQCQGSVAVAEGDVAQATEVAPIRAIE